MVPARALVTRESYSGSCPSSPRPEVSQVSSSLHAPDVFCAVAPALELKVSEFVHRPLWRSASVSSISPSSSETILTSFHSQMLWGLLFLVLVPWAQEPAVGLGNLSPLGETWQLRYPPNS